MALLEEGPEHYAIWKHLVAMVRDGRPNGFGREFGAMCFDYARTNPGYGAVFNQAMSSYSTITRSGRSPHWRQRICPKSACCAMSAAGHGHLACGFLGGYPHLQATVLDLPEVVGETDQLWAPKLGLSDRCRYVGGDMFREVPPADAYVLK